MRIIGKVWIAGANGRLGTAMNRLLDRREVEILNTDAEDVNVANSQEVIRFGDRNRPDAIINCAGLTDVSACEKNVERAFQVNALGARNLAISARKIGARLVHISTDDVFGGPGTTPYREFDTPAPVSVYGKSKLAGEQAVREFAPKHFIVRSAWLYGHGKSYVKELLRKAETGGAVSAPDDQTGSPTSAVELARMVIRLMDTEEYGLYHACCEGSCTRFELAREVFRLTGKHVRLIPISAANDEETNTRPNYSVLDNFMLRITGVYQMPRWQAALADYLRESGVMNGGGLYEE